jgi:hypothetical protein
MRIDAVIRKYNLQWDDQFVSPLVNPSKKEKRFKWANIDDGHILGLFVKAMADTDRGWVFGFYRTLFAKEIDFNPGSETIKCYGWIIVDKDKYEDHIKNLYKQYEKCCKLKKKHQERRKLMQLKKDFK